MEFEHLLFVLLGFAASIVSAVFGFGTALIVLAVGSHILPVKEAIVLGTVLFAASTVFKTVLFGKHVDWHCLWIQSRFLKLMLHLSLALLPKTEAVQTILSSSKFAGFKS